MGIGAASAEVFGLSLPAPALLLGILFLQIVLVGLFAYQLRKLRSCSTPFAAEPEEGWLPLEVVLCLRGADECLPRLLRSLAGQTYAGPWRLQVVVDSDADPAWPLLQPWLNRSDTAWTELHCRTLQQRPSQGSLKCAALRQAFSDLHSESALVLLLDADIRFAEDGLQRCARACLKPGIGAISGNRWFAPPSPGLSELHLSSWTRAAWNAGAVVLMTLWKIPWGGTLCVRRSVVEAGDWLELLRRGLCEDTGLLGPLRRLGLDYRFEPDLIMVDPDPAQPLLPLSRWITRQLLTARLHHPAWGLVALHGLSSAVLLLLALLQGDWAAALIYELGCVGLLCWIEQLIQPQVSPHWLGWAVGLVPGQLVDGAATLAALLVRRISWRGVDYLVRFHPSRVTILRDRGI